MYDLLEIKGTWEQDSLASAQSFEEVPGAAERDELREVLREGPDVGQRPLLRVDTVGGDKGDVPELPLALAFAPATRG